ncbi:MAG TPA: CCA tRNA nucleotidyltransferase, partial [Firmicutes bacterium]|nr:CCA tRNA nucleotidyltransferase [Bacillota bacterium]
MREKDLERRLTEYNYPEELVSTIKTLRGAGYDAFLVGGCVRDIMLEREVVDFDIATDARPEDVIKLFRKVIPTGIKHGTVTVIEGGMEIEITTFRTESGYSDARRPDKVEFVSSIEDDLRRRDFTINAFAYDPLEHEFIDLFDGVSDLSKGVIRAVGDPVERFREDGLRPLRAVRIATALGFEIEMRTLIAIGETLECFKRVAKERVLDELRKIMRAVKPSVGFEYMRETGILEIIFPELLEGYGVTQNEFHAYDIYTHSLYSADFAPIDKPLVRWAALLHDVGKARTREVREDGRVTFYNHEVVSVRMAMVMLERIRFPKKEMEYVCNLIRWH